MTAAARIRYPSKRQVDRAVAQWRLTNPGVDPAAIETRPDGTIRVLGPAAFPSGPTDEFAKWEAQL